MLYITLALIPGRALGCQILPWQLQKLADGSEAIVLGQVIATTQNLRQATLAVVAYTGPGAGPHTLSLPPTESSKAAVVIPANSPLVAAPNAQITWTDCPEHSVQFVAGRTYVVFLRQGLPAPELLDPKGFTALEVDTNGMIPAGLGATETVAVQDLLTQFAHQRGQAVQRPGEDGPALGIGLGAVAFALVAAGLGLALGRVRRLRHP